MPGVRELLDALAARDDVYLALLTGNYEGGARIKLEYFDLWRYFRCGAFGDDAPRSQRPGAESGGARRGMRRARVRGGDARRDRRHAARCRRARRSRARDRWRLRPGVTASRSCARRAPTSSCRTSLTPRRSCASLRISDCGLRIDCGMRNADMRDTASRINLRVRGILQSRNPQLARDHASEGWRKRLGVEPSLPARAGSDRF